MKTGDMITTSSPDHDGVSVFYVVTPEDWDSEGWTNVLRFACGVLVGLVLSFLL